MIAFAKSPGIGFLAPRDGQHYRPPARPRSLAPHVWLPDRRSIYDLFGQGFALIVSNAADEHEVAKAQKQASELGVPLSVVRPAGIDFLALYRAELILVRPDQHVAWRGARWTDEILSIATAQRRSSGIESQASFADVTP